MGTNLSVLDIILHCPSFEGRHIISSVATVPPSFLHFFALTVSLFEPVLWRPLVFIDGFKVFSRMDSQIVRLDGSGLVVDLDDESPGESVVLNQLLQIGQLGQIEHLQDPVGGLGQLGQILQQKLAQLKRLDLQVLDVQFLQLLHLVDLKQDQTLGFAHVRISHIHLKWYGLV